MILFVVCGCVLFRCSGLASILMKAYRLSSTAGKPCLVRQQRGERVPAKKKVSKPREWFGGSGTICDDVFIRALARVVLFVARTFARPNRDCFLLWVVILFFVLQLCAHSDMD
jgi:hypothetical protein